MKDLIYAGIEIDITKPNGILLHAMNMLYNVANNAFAMLTRIPDSEVKKVKEELKVPETYTMPVMADNKDSAYNAMHFILLKPFINDLRSEQIEYLNAMCIFFTEVYSISYTHINPSVERNSRVEKAYKILKYSSDNADLIFTEALMGKQMQNEKMLSFLKQQLKDIVSAKTTTEKMVDKQKESDDGKDNNPSA